MKIILDRNISTTVKLNIEKLQNNDNGNLQENNSAAFEIYYRPTDRYKNHVAFPKAKGSHQRYAVAQLVKALRC